MTDLTTLSLNELKTLQKDIGKAIETFEKRRKAEALQVLQAAAKEHGYRLADLLEESEGARKPAPAAKYANPENPSDTWSGRGRQPRWFKDAVAAGRPTTDLEV